MISFLDGDRMQCSQLSEVSVIAIFRHHGRTVNRTVD